MDNEQKQFPFSGKVLRECPNSQRLVAHFSSVHGTHVYLPESVSEEKIGQQVSGTYTLQETAGLLGKTYTPVANQQDLAFLDNN